VAGSVWQRPVVAEAAKDTLAKRQALAAVALVQLRAPERVWPLLEQRPDPRLRSFLVHRFALLKTEVQALLGQLEQEREVSRRRALLLALGSYPREGLEPAVRTKWLAMLQQWYRAEPDAGLHGAAEWLLRRWGAGAAVAKLEKELGQREQERDKSGQGAPAGAARWYVNGHAQTLTVVPAGAPFWMGSPGDEAGRLAGNEPMHRVRIERAFAIGTKEVTVAQLLRFDPNHRYVAKYSRDPEGPMINVTWFQAAAYCNWLSQQEGVPETEWCYLRNEQDKYDEGMRMAPNYLHKRGYRLPTEAEWEYACRSGAVTRRHYGDADELLAEYAWYTKNTNDEGVRSGGLLKPNDLGLFDTYGNALEWTQNPALVYRWPRKNDKKDLEFQQDIRYIRYNLSRLLRGGSFGTHESDVRSAYRLALLPSVVNNAAGFRVARTCP
jgi:formylglycine-generating enzyme required for sulfatase activity